MSTTTEARPLRICQECGGVDDHPRHVQGLPPGSTHGAPSAKFLDSLPDGTPAAAIALLLNPAQISRHHDCCAALGCVLCAETEKINGGARGSKLVDKILAGSLADHEPPSDLTNADTALPEEG